MQISLPQKPKYTSSDKKTAIFQIEGCYPGYGTTLGNALRRVLLSSLSGAAIVSVKIKNVKHEFSTIPNVAEDIIQIILNLKQVRFKLYGDESVKVNLKVKGEKKITASMIECTSNVEVVNGDAYIASITSPKGEVEIEMEIASGIGYIPVEQQDREKKEVGVIAVDAIYTPIRRVNYTISNMRVGKRTDFEKINLEITTDGSIAPQEAFLKSVEILVEQFSVLKDLGKAGKEKEEEVEEKKENKPEAKKEGVDPLEVEIMGLKSLSTRTLNVLEKAKIKNVGDIVKLNEKEISELEGMGAKGIKEIKKAIGDFGLNLKKTE
ncbi:MAG TPA: DNA-directed RNA polymerase subunit alpha [Candidatus Moranbacteria bacterium]|nr:DNA-directed RNA polymerase subunit alpha [Candidatus Moranbacteria bacterium]